MICPTTGRPCRCAPGSIRAQDCAATAREVLERLELDHAECCAPTIERMRERFRATTPEAAEQYRRRFRREGTARA